MRRRISEMGRRARIWTWVAALGLTLAGVAVGQSPAQAPADPARRIDFDEAMDSVQVGGGGASGVVIIGDDGARLRDYNQVIQGAKRIDGLFTLHQKGEHLYAEIRPDQFNQPLLLPVTIARGLGQAGTPVSEDDMVLVFRRVGNRVQLVRRNIHYKATGGGLDKAIKQNYVDSILMSIPVVAVNRNGGGAPLIDLSDIFLTDFAQLGLGSMDRSRSGWHRVKGFPNNMELEVEATFNGGNYYGLLGGGGDDGVADPRGITLVVHYSLMKTPNEGYRPRLADDRVGHFLSASKDYAKTDGDSNFVRYIDRWRLEKADPHAELSPPKKQIVWYVEDTVPVELRPYVESGIREWNKAFERIGFAEAIAVRWQEAGRDEFDPEDTNYCTFRWATTNNGYAFSGLRANPLTGEMIDGDVVFDSVFLRAWKQEYALLVGAAGTAAGGPDAATVRPLALGEVISPILAAKMGFGQPAVLLPGVEGLDGPANKLAPEAMPATTGGLRYQMARRAGASPAAACQFHAGMSQDFGLAAIAFAEADVDAGKGDDKAKERDKKKGELPREFIGQALKHVVMHEVGHSLGLRHNFKASTMLTADQLNDPAITRVKGNTGSVMDYTPINIAPRGRKQGDFYSTTLGPYDYWAIEYAYKQVDGDEGEELKKIAARAPEADLQYATDEDLRTNGDPFVNQFDLGSDPCQFAKDRIELSTELLKGLDAKVVRDGESWSKNRRAFAILLNQWGNAAVLASQYVGGQSVARDHKGDKDGRDPIVPVPGAKQRECLRFVADQILTDKAFQYSPTLLRRLGTEKWYHWGSNNYGAGVDISVLETILGIQKIVLSHCLSPSTLYRLQNQQLQAEAGVDPLRTEEVYRTLTDAIWADPGKDQGKDKAALLSSTIRRNLQREYLHRLGAMVLGTSSSNALGDQFAYMVVRRGGASPVPADARALARLHLAEIGDRIDATLANKDLTIDDTTKAHLKESRQRVTKILDAQVDVREP